MTVSNTKSAVSYQGTGGQTRFDFSFLIPKGTAIVSLVETAPEGGYKTTVLAASQFSIIGEGDPAGGYVLLNEPPSETQRVTIRRVLPLTQETDLVTGAGFYPESVEDMVDESRMIDQQLAEALSRAVRVPEGVGTDPMDYYNTMLEAAQRALAAISAASEAVAAKDEAQASLAAALAAKEAAIRAAEAAEAASEGELPLASDVKNGLMSFADFAKLAGIATGATADAPSDAPPQMDGEANAGTGNDYARGDHVHPTDTSRASIDDLTAIPFSTRVIITASGPYIATKTGWHKGRAIPGGGGGGKALGGGGGAGGDTSFGDIVAMGGGGGGGARNAEGGGGGAGGGGQGLAVDFYVYLTKGQSIDVKIGAGGTGGTGGTVTNGAGVGGGASGYGWSGACGGWGASQGGSGSVLANKGGGGGTGGNGAPGYDGGYGAGGGGGGGPGNWAGNGIGGNAGSALAKSGGTYGSDGGAGAPGAVILEF